MWCVSVVASWSAPVGITVGVVSQTIQAMKSGVGGIFDVTCDVGEGAFGNVRLDTVGVVGVESNVKGLDASREGVWIVWESQMVDRIRRRR